jgi:hypothetical protein
MQIAGESDPRKSVSEGLVKRTSNVGQTIGQTGAAEDVRLVS